MRQTTFFSVQISLCVIRTALSHSGGMLGHMVLLPEHSMSNKPTHDYLDEDHTRYWRIPSHLANLDCWSLILDSECTEWGLWILSPIPVSVVTLERSCFTVSTDMRNDYGDSEIRCCTVPLLMCFYRCIVCLETLPRSIPYLDLTIDLFVFET